MRRLASFTVALGLLTTGPAAADEVRYYEQNGVTYRETVRTVKQPVSQTEYQTQQRTVLREQVTSNAQPLVHRQWAPVRDWRYETRWVGRFNPFVQPYPVEKLVPYTRWELRESVSQVPITRRELVPETVEVRVPVTTRRVVEQQVVSSRVVVQSPSTLSSQARLSNQAQLANRPTIGGIANLDESPARGGGWRPSVSTIRR